MISGKNETNAFPAERDAAVDEFCLEQSLPHLPQKGPLSTTADRVAVPADPLEFFLKSCRSPWQ